MTKKQPSDYGRKTSDDGHVVVSPMPSVTELNDFYTNVYFSEVPSDSYDQDYDPAELAHKKLVAETLVTAVSGWNDPASPETRRLLEVGFGEGFVLAAAKAQGYDIQGFDFSGDGLARFNPDVQDFVTLGDPALLLRESAEQGQTYSICVLKNVVEHVPDAEAILDLTKTLLSDDGILVVTVPNDFSCLQTTLLEKGIVDKEYWWAPPQHLHYFNTETFPTFAEKRGLEILDDYGDFPIEFFLLHSGSNYVLDKSNGKEAHQARLALDLMMAEAGLSQYTDFCRALSKCGMGRNTTYIMRQKTKAGDQA